MEVQASGTIGEYLWIIEILMGILILGGIYFVVKKIFKHIRLRSLSVPDNWKKRIDYICVPPFKILLWVVGVTLVIEILAKRFDFSFFSAYIDPFRSTAFVLCAAWLLLRWKVEVHHVLFNKNREGKKIDANFAHLFGKILSVIIVIIALMIALQIWGLDIGPLIAFGGIGAAAVAFASKDIIANFFGGIMLHTTRPFVVGDCVIIPEKDLEAYVEEIGWYMTALRDKQKRPVYLPNAFFAHTLTINSSRMTHRRIEEKVTIRYDDFAKMQQLVGKIKRAIEAHSAIDKHLPIILCLKALGEFALELYMDIYTLETRYENYLLVKEEILALTYSIIIDEGAKLPFPTMTILQQKA